MSKFAWGEDDHVIEKPASPLVENITIFENQNNTDVNQNLLNGVYAFIKSLPAMQQLSRESVDTLLFIRDKVFKQGNLVSKEDRLAVETIPVSLSLESVNDYTTVPSEYNALNFIKEISLSSVDNMGVLIRQPDLIEENIFNPLKEVLNRLLGTEDNSLLQCLEDIKERANIGGELHNRQEEIFNTKHGKNYLLRENYYKFKTHFNQVFRKHKENVYTRRHLNIKIGLTDSVEEQNSLKEEILNLDKETDAAIALLNQYKLIGLEKMDGKGGSTMVPLTQEEIQENKHLFISEFRNWGLNEDNVLLAELISVGKLDKLSEHLKEIVSKYQIGSTIQHPKGISFDYNTKGESSYKNVHISSIEVGNEYLKDYANDVDEFCELLVKNLNVELDGGSKYLTKDQARLYAKNAEIHGNIRKLISVLVSREVEPIELDTIPDLIKFLSDYYTGQMTCIYFQAAISIYLYNILTKLIEWANKDCHGQIKSNISVESANTLAEVNMYIQLLDEIIIDITELFTVFTANFIHYYQITMSMVEFNEIAFKLIEQAESEQKVSDSGIL